MCVCGVGMLGLVAVCCCVCSWLGSTHICTCSSQHLAVTGLSDNACVFACTDGKLCVSVLAGSASTVWLSVCCCFDWGPYVCEHV